jgi:hypothetical protein
VEQRAKPIDEESASSLEQVDQIDQCTSIKRYLVQSPTYHGSLHVEDAVVPVLLQTEGRYEIRGSVFSIIVASAVGELLQ